MHFSSYILILAALPSVIGDDYNEGYDAANDISYDDDYYDDDDDEDTYYNDDTYYNNEGYDDDSDYDSDYSDNDYYDDNYAEDDDEMDPTLLQFIFDFGKKGDSSLPLISKSTPQSKPKYAAFDQDKDGKVS